MKNDQGYFTVKSAPQGIVENIKQIGHDIYDFAEINTVFSLPIAIPTCAVAAGVSAIATFNSAAAPLNITQTLELSAATAAATFASAWIGAITVSTAAGFVGLGIEQAIGGAYGAIEGVFAEKIDGLSRLETSKEHFNWGRYKFDANLAIGATFAGFAVGLAASALAGHVYSQNLIETHFFKSNDNQAPAQMQVINMPKQDVPAMIAAFRP